MYRIFCAFLGIGYARVSTEAQDLTAQRDALQTLGVKPERIYVDHGFTGTNRARPGLREALAACRAGDELVVTKLDRLARSLPDARAIAEELTAREVKLNLGGSDPTDPVGRLLFNVLAMVAEFEADLILARTREDEGRAYARGHEGREGQGTPVWQAAQAQHHPGGAPRQALPRRRAHRERARGALRRHPLDRLPRHPPRPGIQDSGAGVI
ncbi:MAG: recombinase family protein [Solirubrobacteraceae bacterium]